MPDGFRVFTYALSVNLRTMLKETRIGQDPPFFKNIEMKTKA